MYLHVMPPFTVISIARYPLLHMSLPGLKVSPEVILQVCFKELCHTPHIID